jgi:hypothetical protein
MSPPEMCAHIRLISESEDRGDRVSHGRVCTTPTVPYPSSAKVRAIAMGSGTSLARVPASPQIHRFWSEAPAPRCLWNAAIFSESR